MRDTPDISDDKRHQFLAIMVQESERLSRLIEEILDLARLESGRFTMSPQPVDLVVLARQSSDALARLHQEEALTFELVVQPETAMVEADPDRLEQVIINLLENARKFAHHTHPEIMLSVEAYEDHFRLSVDDNGPGIPEEEREHVFEKFYQLQRNGHSSPQRPKGSGLGLPISRAIVQHLGENCGQRPRPWVALGCRSSYPP